MSLFISIIAFIVILAVLVLVHEFGHFIVAKKFGIRVDEFGFGFPPRAKKLFTRQGTDFTLNWIPFGGFVKIFGENGQKGEIHEDSFVSKSKWIQAAVLFAGPLFNLLFAWFILTCMFMFGSPTIYDESYAENLKNISVVVVEVFPDSPADRADLLIGDSIINIQFENGNIIPVETSEDIASAFVGKGTGSVVLEVLRKDEVLAIPITPAFGLYEGQEYPALGIALDRVGILQLPPHKALWKGLERTWNLTEGTAYFVFNSISNLIQGDSTRTNAITGPVGIVPVVGDAIRVGFSFVVVITALISINLAVINLLPFPALDGGRLLFIFIETIKGSPMNPKTTSWVTSAGFIVLLGLMVLVTIRDIVQLF